MVEQDVAYDIEQSANSVDFDESVVDSEIVSEESAEPEFMKGE